MVPEAVVGVEKVTAFVMLLKELLLLKELTNVVGLVAEMVPESGVLPRLRDIVPLAVPK